MSSDADLRDEELMRAALVEARRGLGHTTPNPAVGCVVSKKGQAVAAGFHAKAGGPHAEIEALRRAGRAARGATLHVTLEPCCFHGTTPPCTEAVIAAAPARVVVGTRDPNPNVAGRGIRALRAAGIRVEVGVLERECQDFIRGFSHWIRFGRPWVHLKLAATLDGRIATRTGASEWISSPPSRRIVQELRARADAVLVGVETVLADDPRLTCRIKGARQPLRVVLDRRLRTPARARVLKGGAPTLLVCAVGARRAARERALAAGADIVALEGSEHTIWRRLLDELGRRNVHELLIEGGAQVASSVLRARMVNGLTFFYNPRIIGGDGIPMIGPLGIDDPSTAMAAVTRSWSMSGDDLVWHGEMV